MLLAIELSNDILFPDPFDFPFLCCMVSCGSVYPQAARSVTDPDLDSSRKRITSQPTKAM